LIPHIIHQTWKDANVPERYQAWHASWKRLNPGFELRLWTDADIAGFVATHYPQWQAVMRDYQAPISRIDLARYLILHHHGGVYADLDEECLKPFAPLLAGREFIIGTEPVSHEMDPKARSRGLKGLLCPTVIASRPGHPFWEHLFSHLRATAAEPDPLDATGPFLLTRAHADYRGPPIEVVAPHLFYPFDREQCEAGIPQDRSAWPKQAREAYATHYWEGTWWRSRVRGVRVTLFGNLSSPTGLGSAGRGTAAALAAAGVPLSCTDIVDGPEHRQPFAPGESEGALARRLPETLPVDIVHTNPDGWRFALQQGDPGAARSLRPNRLRIGFWAWEGQDGIPRSWYRALRHVHEVWVPSEFTARAVSAHVPVPVVAMGHPVVAQPGPLDRRALGLPEGSFVFLTVLDALSNLQRKNLEGTVRAFQAAFPKVQPRVRLVLKVRNLSAQALQQLEHLCAGRPDIQVIPDTMSREALASLMNCCDAYVSLHRAEGFGLTIAEAMALGKPVIATDYSANTEFMPSGTGYPVRCRMITLEKSTGVYRAGTRWADPDRAEASRLMRHLVAQPDAGRATGARAAAHVGRTLSPEAIGRKMRARLLLLAEYQPLAPPRPGSKPDARPLDPGPVDSAPRAAAPHTGSVGGSPPPRVLVLTPMKNTAAHLERYARLLEALDHPREALSLCILEGDSTDDTWAGLQAMRDRFEQRCSRVDLFTHDDGTRIAGPRWAPAVQRVRRAAIARARNRLLSLGLRDEAWVLWLDADLLSYPPSLLTELLGAGKDLVVPHCLNEDGGTFDRNTFVFSPDRSASERPEYLLDGLYQPPSGRGRAYLGAYRGQALVPVDAVGGTALLVRADLHRDGLVFPPWPHRGYIETEGLAMAARDMGVVSWGMPDLEIVHIRG
jgi:glycosyltransferase involved in cell wall biosynthesis